MAGTYVAGDVVPQFGSFDTRTFINVDATWRIRNWMCWNQVVLPTRIMASSALTGPTSLTTTTYDAGVVGHQNQVFKTGVGADETRGDPRPGSAAHHRRHGGHLRGGRRGARSIRRGASGTRLWLERREAEPDDPPDLHR